MENREPKEVIPGFELKREALNLPATTKKKEDFRRYG